MFGVRSLGCDSARSKAGTANVSVEPPRRCGQASHYQTGKTDSCYPPARVQAVGRSARVWLSTYGRRQTCCSCCPPRRSSRASMGHHIRGSSAQVSLRTSRRRMEPAQRRQGDTRDLYDRSRSLFPPSCSWSWRRCQLGTGARSACLEGSKLLEGTARDAWSPPCTGCPQGCDT